MSEMQDFERARQMIGSKKYDAIQKYLDKISPQEKHDAFENDLRIYEKSADYSPDNWHNKRDELKKKHGVVFLDEVLYNQQEWAKFDAWYKLNNKQKSDRER
jgi:cephalosporin-C deacetylase-like acetyl esterase